MFARVDTFFLWKSTQRGSSLIAPGSLSNPAEPAQIYLHHIASCALRFPLQRYFVGRRMVRHMCEAGVLSKPKPSFGCLKLRPTMSMKGSQLTTALGSKE